jgi:flagellar basal body rod protein FlgF
MYIGTDYIESNGQKIDVKEQDDGKFLIMQTQEGDQAYIIDKDGSLLIKSGIATIKFTKID